MGVSVAEWLLNFGVAGVVLVLIVTGALVPGFVFKDLQKANEKLTDALSVERQRNADLQQMAATGAKALDSLAQVAQEQRARRGREDAAMQRAVTAPSTSPGDGA
jgi:Tfp pilus assembly protein PilN